MYLLYADESGDLTDPTASVFVVGAIVNVLGRAVSARVVRRLP